MSIKLDFNTKNFLSRLIFHPEDGKTEKDCDRALAATIILGIFTLGMTHLSAGLYQLGCYLYDKYHVKQKGEENLSSEDTKTHSIAQDQGIVKKNINGLEGNAKVETKEVPNPTSPLKPDLDPNLAAIENKELDPKELDPMAELIECMALLSDLSHIQPNKDVHLDRHGRLIHTAPGLSWFPGAQTLAGWVKGHQKDKLTEDLNKFSERFSQAMEATLSEFAVTKQGACLLFIQQKIQEAIGISKQKGLEVLKDTYQDNPEVLAEVNKLVDALNAKKDEIDEMLKDPEIIKDGHSDALNQVWRGYSQKLRPEEMGLGASYKYVCQYNVALLYSHLNCTAGDWNWQDKIGDYGNGGAIYLGVLPTISPWQNTLEWMKEENVTSVLSVVEAFENQSEGLLVQPISPKKFAEEGVEQIQLEAADFETLPMEDIERGVEYLHDALSKGKRVYVHCKAGRARSALIVACYLVKYQKMKAKEALDHVRAQRKQAGFKENESKWNSLIAFEEKWGANKD